jgi:HAMP domain-containing protein/HPt (histidine-containing phosphotransfer) domain-containing protein
MSLRDRSTSLGIKLALATVVVLSILSILLYQQLTSRERQHLVSSKTRAAIMVSELFAASLAAPLDFGDSDAVETELNNLRSNGEIVEASVWTLGADAPVAELHPNQWTADTALRERSDGTRIFVERVEIIRTVTGRQGKRVGKAVVAFSLAPENAAFYANRIRIMWATVAMDAITALILILIARYQIIRPLEKVAEGTRRLERGELDSRVDVTSRDEVGQLARAFNSMGAAIADREQRLEAARKSLRDLFDHMRQAIFAFGPDGKIVGETSKQAVRVFGYDHLEGMDVRDLLYHDAPDHDVDAQAFDEWIKIAFGVSEADWDDVARLAPGEVSIRAEGTAPVPLLLEFRPVAKRGRVRRIMLLATDISEQRQLQRTVQSREEEHARQMAAMRRLVAGGPQVFVMFIDGARQRIARCLEIIGPSVRALPSAEIDELFRHVHTMKGEAKAFDMRDLEAQTSKLEEELDELRARARGDGFATTASVHSALLAHFVRATEALDRGCEVFIAASPTGKAALDQVTVQRTDILDLMSLVGQDDGPLGQIASRLASRPLGEATANLVDLVPTWAEREGKRARLAVEGREVRVPPQLARVLGGALTHLIRNAIVHGIELPQARHEAGKSAIGLIQVLAAPSPEGPVITVEDDGQGLDLAQIRERAAAIGENIGSRSAQELAFLPGLSTAARPGDLAGRGFGLSAVRSDLSDVGYVVEVFSQAGHYARFVLRPKGVAGGALLHSKNAHAQGA